MHVQNSLGILCTQSCCLRSLLGQSCTWLIVSISHPSNRSNKIGSYLGRLSNRLYHLLNHHRPHPLLGLTHANGHVLEQRWVSDVARIAVSLDVARPFELGGVGVAGADELGLQLLELLLGA